MATISRSQMQKELVPGLHLLFGADYKTYDMEWKELVELDTSERSFEEETKLALFSASPVTQEGQGLTYQTAQEAWTSRYTMETVKDGFALTEEAIEDNLYVNVAKRYTKALVRSMAYTKEVKVAGIYNLGFTGSGNPTYGDGMVLFATNHPLISGGTNSNRPASGVDLNETAIEAAYIQIAGWTDERGLLIAAKPRKLIIPKDLAFTATRVVKTDLRPGTMNNDLNAIKNMNVIPEGLAVNHYLTDTNGWFIKTDVPNGAKLFQRVSIKTSSEGDFDTGNFRYKARERYAVGITDPLGLWGSPGA